MVDVPPPTPMLAEESGLRPAFAGAAAGRERPLRVLIARADAERAWLDPVIDALRDLGVDAAEEPDAVAAHPNGATLGGFDLVAALCSRHSGADPRFANALDLAQRIDAPVKAFFLDHEDDLSRDVVRRFRDRRETVFLHQVVHREVRQFMTLSQIAGALGLDLPQAVVQRFNG